MIRALGILVLIGLAAAAAGPVVGEGRVDGHPRSVADASATATAEAPVTLYAHINGLQDFVLATNEPPERARSDVQVGAVGHSTSCLPEVPQASLVSRDLHTWYGFVQASRVEYGLDGNAHTMIERGLAYDLNLTGQPMFHWYLSSPSAATLGSYTAPVPVRVDVAVRLGQELSVDRAGLDAGELVASGSSGVVLTAPGQPEHSTSGGRDVYHFAVPLEVARAHIPADVGFHIRVDARVDAPVCQEDGKILPDHALHASPGHRPRLEWGLAGPLRVEGIDAMVLNGTLVLAAAVQSVFGGYDVGQVEARLIGPGGDVPVTALGPDHAYHCHCYPPPADTLRWQAAPAGAGEYVWHLNATNAQGTAQAGAVASLSIAADAKAPGLAVGWLLAPLALLGRRRPAVS